MNSTTDISANGLNDAMRDTVLPGIIFVGFEIIIGLFGNLLILYIYFFRYRRCNFRYFVLCLAVTDTLATLIIMPGELITLLYWYIYPFPIFCRIKSFFNGFTIFSSAFCLFIISVDRYRKVCRPLEWQIRPTIALRLCLLQWVISFVLSVPIGFLAGTFSYQERYMGQLVNVTVDEKDEHLRFTKYPLIYTISKETILSIVMISMLMIYVVICQKLWKTKFSMVERSAKQNNANNIHSLGGETDISRFHDAQRGQDTSETIESTDGELENMPTSVKQIPVQSTPPQERSNKPDVQTKRPIGKKSTLRVRRKTFIMLILTAVFVITTILYLTLLNLIMKGILRYLTNTQKGVYFFFFRLYFINHVINPILFGVMDQEFRKILKQTWQCMRLRD